jgi:hypothetical protein
MARIPLPNRGQPLDVNYIYQIAESVNTLSTQISPALNKYITIDTVSSGKQDVKSSDIRMIGGYVEVANNSTVSAGNEISFSINYSGFKFTPIVTATPINIDGTAAGSDISVILKNITTSKTDGVVKFKSSGNVSIGVNVIALGIPN